MALIRGPGPQVTYPQTDFYNRSRIERILILSFDEVIARTYGLHEAIIWNLLTVYFKDQPVTAESLALMMPFLKLRSIERALRHLQREKMLKSLGGLYRQVRE
jgi:hypothetical protein